MKLLVADACAVVEFCCCCCGWERPGCGTTGWRGFPNGCALGVESLAGGEWATRWLRLMRWASLLDFALLLLLLFLAVALSMSRVSLSLLLSRFCKEIYRNGQRIGKFVRESKEIVMPLPVHAKIARFAGKRPNLFLRELQR